MASQITWLLFSALLLVSHSSGLPDSAGVAPLPGPGLSYGGIPYGSVSGNVAEYFKRQATSSGQPQQLAPYSEVDFAPIEQYL
ncbi:uncharacterized protein LOC132901952 [Amyelois transitella]|uniref:uncharacterized protein LOC132901952 n=1 Tax=Amyelois transitella TaxID=680683 RepID=UPI002990720D|nr:uncharacterized protein LOC132901952 [Amyelois transitella]